MNVSGGGMAAHAPNKDHALKLLEFFASHQPQAQSLMSAAGWR